VEAARFDTYYRYDELTRVVHDYAVQNSGWLPTDLTRYARERKLARGVVCEVELPERATLIGNTPRKVPGQLVSVHKYLNSPQRRKARKVF